MESIQSSRQSTRRYDDVISTETPTNTTEGIFYFYKEEQMTFLYILLAMILVGNSLVVLAITLTKSRKSRMHIFILNLAIADLSAGLVNVLTDIVWKNTISWHAGNGGCKVIRYAQVVVTYAATYALVALSLDRLNAIARPLSFSSDRLRIRVLLGLAWGCSVVFALPMLFINNLTLVDGRWQCWIEFSEDWMWQLYLTSIAVVLFFIPAIIIAVCYSIIVIIIWTKTAGASQTRESTQHIKNGSQIYVAANNSRFREGNASSGGIIPRAKMKTIKMTLVIVLVFIICWSPYFVWDLLSVYDYIPMTQDTIALSTFIQSLAPLNSAANPVIYACFNTNMCLDLFRCRFSKRRNNFTGSQATNYTHFRFGKRDSGTPTIPLYRGTTPQAGARVKVSSARAHQSAGGHCQPDMTSSRQLL